MGLIIRHLPASLMTHDELMSVTTRRLGRPPRVLVIAPTFPPASLPGAPRTWNIATRLRKLSWEVTVATIDWRQRLRVEGVERVAAEMAGLSIRRIDIREPWPVLDPGLLRLPRGCPLLLSRILRRIAVHAAISPHFGWARAAKRRLHDGAAGRPDVVVASAPSHVALPLGLQVADRLNRPFVADYRDLWSGNAYLPPHAAKRHAAHERGVTTRAAAAIVVSPSAADWLHERFGIGPKVHVLTNGYDADLLRDVIPRRFDHFSIVYAGIFYPPVIRVTPLLEALALLHRRQAIPRDWRFHYYGANSAYVRRVAAEVGLPASRYELHGWVLRAEALQAVAGADLATVIATAGDAAPVAERAIIPGKIFEAIGLRKQFLVIAPRGSDVARVTEEAGLGRVVPGVDIEGIATAIAQRAQGTTVPPRSPETYDWKNIAPRFSAVLLNVLGR